MIEEKGIHPHGYWYGDIIGEHRFDASLAHAIAQFLKNQNANSVVDIGCGLGEYVKVIKKYQIECEGYDGHPETATLSDGIAHTMDFSKQVNLKKSFDWVLSLEVGEHIPKKYEKNFFENLHKHNHKGIILSWAVKGQGGFGHFNEQDNDYVKKILKEYGYINDIKSEKNLRNSASLSWFKNTLMVFKKNSHPLEKMLGLFKFKLVRMIVVLILLLLLMKIPMPPVIKILQNFSN